MSIQPVKEFAATAEEHLDYFAELLSKSANKRHVFEEIYWGKSKNAKTAAEIGAEVGLTAKRVMEIAGPLARVHLFEQTKRDGYTAYRKYDDINTIKRKILRLATNPKKLEAHPTVRKPRLATSEIRIKVAPSQNALFLHVRHITVDDIDNFSKVRSLKHNKVPDKLEPTRLAEKVFKTAVAHILGNKGVFTDWGGEKSDLYTTHLRIGGKRHAAAIGFKGPAVKGVLTPGKMGHNGDQIQRLFESDAQVFLVQYEGRIAESVSQQLRALAINKSVETRQTILYGTVALEDSYRLRLRYGAEFAKAMSEAK